MSLCAAIFSLGFSHAYHLPESNFWLVFSGTLFVYLGQRYYKIRKNDFSINAKRIEWMNQNPQLVKALLIGSFVVFATLASRYMIHYPKSMLLFGIAGFISIVYVVKIGQWNLREIPFLKVFLVVAAFACITMGLQIQKEHIVFDNKVIRVLFYIFGLTLLFDIPDRNIDATSNKTFAQVLGVPWTIVFSAFCVSFYFLFKSYHGGAFGSAAQAIGALILLAFYIQLPKKVDTEFYLSFFGEGLLCLYFFIH